MSDKKFNIGKPDLPDEQINKHKDFKKLMYNYQTGTSPLYKTPLYKNKKVFLIILLILLIIFVLGEVIEKDEKPVNTQQTK
ncbi:MAG: hypothetical protein K0Q95_1325 [Bacteroidota bacterium]|jgi:hypothetical protein|nr:hypothetical protein [Bacteroidota bacterium]